MNPHTLVSDNEYILKDANSCVVLRFKYEMWTLRSGMTYYFDINKQIYPKINVFGELKLTNHDVKTKLYEDFLINSIEDLYR